MEVRLVGGREPLAVLQPSRDDERRVEDRHGEDEQRQEEHDRRRGLEEPLHRDRSEQEAERERAGVAHEDPGREEVVAEEAETGAGDDRREDRRVGLPEREGEDRVRGGGDPAHPGRQPVQPVEEVDHVHDRDDPEHRQRDADRGRQVDGADERKREVVDPDAEERRNRSRDHLAGQLPAGLQHPEVVDRADGRRHRRPEHDAHASRSRGRGRRAQARRSRRRWRSRRAAESG